MSVIALFYGIKITMYDSGAPPHFHAKYAEHEAVIDILLGTVVSGYLQARQLKLVLAWAELHRDELVENWELAKTGQSLRSIEGLR